MNPQDAFRVELSCTGDTAMVRSQSSMMVFLRGKLAQDLEDAAHKAGVSTTYLLEAALLNQLPPENPEDSPDAA